MTQAAFCYWGLISDRANTTLLTWNINYRRISRSVGKFQIISRELELAVRGADKPRPDCGDSVCLEKNVGQKIHPPGLNFVKIVGVRFKVSVCLGKNM